MATDDLRNRIAAAVARVTASKAADEVIAEIERTHVLIDFRRWDRVATAARLAVHYQLTGVNTGDLDEPARVIAIGERVG